MSAADLSYVQRTYGVPAEPGMRVVHEGRDHGVIVSGDSERAYVMVQFDGEQHPAPCHPLSLDYGDGVDPKAREAQQNARIDIWNDWLNGRIDADEYRRRWAAA